MTIHKVKRSLLLLLLSVALTRADVLPDALLLFPADTKSVEYDNLGELRRLPNYQTLRQQYALSATLQRALLSFRKLGITEDAVQQVITGSNAEGLYGIALGTFSGEDAWKRATRAAFTKAVIEKEQIVCPKGPVCVWFFEDATAVFGSYAQIRRMIEARNGTIARLLTNATLTDLLTHHEQSAPLVGVGPGSDVIRWIGETIPRGLTRILENVQWFSYAVSFPSIPHIEMKLVCSSEADAQTLQQVLSALSAIRQVEHATVSSTGSMVTVTAETHVQ